MKDQHGCAPLNLAVFCNRISTANLPVEYKHDDINIPNKTIEEVIEGNMKFVVS
jgi:hypothetical protein